MGLSLVFKLAKIAASTQLVVKVAKEVEKFVPAETRKKISKTFGKVQAKTEEAAILGLEKFAPDTVAKLTKRNAPETVTKEDLETVIRDALNQKLGTSKPAKSAGTKKKVTLK